MYALTSSLGRIEQWYHARTHQMNTTRTHTYANMYEYKCSVIKTNFMTAFNNHESILIEIIDDQFSQQYCENEYPNQCEICKSNIAVHKNQWRCTCFSVEEKMIIEHWPPFLSNNNTTSMFPSISFAFPRNTLLGNSLVKALHTMATWFCTLKPKWVEASTFISISDILHSRYMRPYSLGKCILLFPLLLRPPP